MEYPKKRHETLIKKVSSPTEKPEFRYTLSKTLTMEMHPMQITINKPSPKPKRLIQNKEKRM